MAVRSEVVSGGGGERYLKTGGKIFYFISAAGGGGLGGGVWGSLFFYEIVYQNRMVVVSTFCVSEGDLVVHLIVATVAREVHNTLTLEEKNGKTTVTLRGGPLNATHAELDTFEAGRGGMQQGFAGTWQQLDEYLASIQ